MSDFYVYIYADNNGVPVYVGKGTGRRAWDHIWRADNIGLALWLEEQRAAGQHPQPEIVASHLSEYWALTIESALIGHYGKRANGGLLFNAQTTSKASGAKGVAVVINGKHYRTTGQAARTLGVSWSKAHRLASGSQTKAQRTGRPITVGGVFYASVSQACRALGKSRDAINNRLRAGWTPEQAFDLEPVVRKTTRPKEIACNGAQFRSVSALATKHGLPPSTVARRLGVGWSPEQAVGLEPAPGAVLSDGKQYRSLRALARALRLPRNAVRKQAAQLAAART